MKFEVFGKVQGVGFRKLTKRRADFQDIKGWCKYTPNGTVKGEAIGDNKAIPDVPPTGSSVIFFYTNRNLFL